MAKNENISELFWL